MWGAPVFFFCSITTNFERNVMRHNLLKLAIIGFAVTAAGLASASDKPFCDQISDKDAHGSVEDFMQNFCKTNAVLANTAVGLGEKCGWVPDNSDKSVQTVRYIVQNFQPTLKVMQEYKATGSVVKELPEPTDEECAVIRSMS